jgi:STE24 endopeptidase
MFSSFICVALLMFIQTSGIFFEWFSQFRIEERFGFNNSTLKLWMSDKLKESIIGLIIGTLLFALLIWLYRILSNWSDYWWLVAFLVFFLLQLSLMVIWPRFILPLFNKLSPLEEGELKSRLMTLAERTGFAASTIEVIDGSKRSSHSNAYFTGFGRFRRIVLYDTLVDQMKQDEIEAVLAHEIGHYKLGHIPKRLFFSFIFGLLAFWGLDYALSQETIYSGLGLGGEYLGSLAVLLVAAVLFLPCFTYWLSPLSNFFSRKHEFEADRFAADSIDGGGALVNALTKLYQENLSHPIPHSLIVFFHYSHPPYFERIRALSNFQK